MARHFSQLKIGEVLKMIDRCINAAIKYSDEIGMGGLSDSGFHDIYQAIDKAIYSEWIRSTHEVKKLKRKEKEERG